MQESRRGKGIFQQMAALTAFYPAFSRSCNVNLPLKKFTLW
jgi:hypothetical protein